MQVVTTSQDFNTMLSDLYSSPVFSFDTETTGLDPYTSDLLLMSFATEYNSYVVDVGKSPKEWLSAIATMLQKSTAVKVMHNAVFDMMVVYHFLNVVISNPHCTLITDQLLLAGLSANQGFSLADVAQRRLGIVLDKTVRTGFIGREDHTFSTEELLYSAKDAEILLPIYKQQSKEVPLAELDRVYRLEMDLLPITMDMTYTGVEIDSDKMRSAVPLVQEVIDKADAALQRLFLQAGVADSILVGSSGFRVANMSSVKQVLRLVQAVGINVSSLSAKELSEWDNKWSSTSTNQVHDEALDEFHVGYEHPVLKWLAIHTAANKLMGTYLVGMSNRINPVTGRIHPGFKQCGAVSTGRYSSSQPNFQNLPNSSKTKALSLSDVDIRSMVIAGWGNKFIIADYSGIELVILAAMSGDEGLIYQVTQGDIHSYVANSLFGDTILKHTGSLITPENKGSNGPWKTLRNSFKTVSYGIIYGSTGWNLHRTCSNALASIGIHLTPEEADRWVQAWQHELFPKTGKLLTANASHAVTRGYTTSVLGRRRYWDLPFVRSQKWAFSAAMREGMNQPIQGSSADMTKKAMVYTHRELDGARARIALTVHDELVVCAENEYVDEAARITKDCMERAGNELFPILPIGAISVEPKISTCYDK